MSDDILDNCRAVVKKPYGHRAIIVSCRGKANTALKHNMGQRVFAPTFEIYKNPTIRLSDIKSRRFSLIDRNIKHE